MGGRPEWQQRGLCRDADPDLWFPLNEGHGPDRLAAKAICSRCPVVDECLDYAVETGQAYGIWGGKDSAERRGLRRRTPTPRPAVSPGAVVQPTGNGCGTTAGYERHRRRGENACAACKKAISVAKAARKAAREAVAA